MSSAALLLIGLPSPQIFVSIPDLLSVRFEPSVGKLTRVFLESYGSLSGRKHGMGQSRICFMIMQFRQRLSPGKVESTRG